MWNNGHDAYLESTVLSADSLELVRMLYQACTVAVRDARQYLAEGKIAERSHAINKAFEILVELGSSLDRERGGEISERLAALYDYMERRLLDANIRQADAPLTEVLGLLATLSEAWNAVRPAAPQPAIQTQCAWSQAPAGDPAAGSHAWSL